MLKDEVVNGTKIYKEKVEWIKKMKEDGYKIIGIDLKENTNKSTFYEMEEQQFIKDEIKKLPKDIGKKISILIKRVKAIFYPLESYGYTIEDIQFDRSLVVKYALNIVYNNSKIDRKIIIHYEPFDIDDKNIDFLTLSITKATSPEEKIEFDRLLEKRNTKIDSEFLLYINYNKTTYFSQNIEITLKEYLLYLLKVAEDIIIGEKWEEELKFKWGQQLEKTLYKDQKNLLYGK